MPAHERGAVKSLAFGQNGEILAAIGKSSNRRVYRWKITQDAAEELEPLMLDFDPSAISVSCCDLLAVGDGTSTSVHLFDLSSQQLVGSLTLPHTGNTCCIAFSPAGKQCAVGYRDGNVRVWNLNTRKPSFVQLAH